MASGHNFAEGLRRGEARVGSWAYEGVPSWLLASARRLFAVWARRRCGGRAHAGRSTHGSICTRGGVLQCGHRDAA